MLRSSGLVRRQRRGGGNPPAPAVTLAVGDAASNTLKFTLTLSDADKCTYVCTKSSEAVPSAEKILADGKSVTASGLITIGDLEPSTTYRLSAVASNGKVNGKVETIEHTTSAPDVHPAVVLTPGTPTSTTLSFTAALTDPETAAYVCLEKTEGTTVPTAEEILRDGTAIAQTGELLVENLKPATVYLIAAAVANTGIYSEVETLEMETVARTPVVTVIAGTPTETTLSFHFKLTDAEKAAYVCLEKTEGLTVPAAEEILRDGTDLPVSADVTEIRDLKPGTTYIVAVAASNKTVYSDVKTVEMTTDQAVEGPIVFDRQAAGGYYPTESSYIGEFLLELLCKPLHKSSSMKRCKRLMSSCSRSVSRKCSPCGIPRNSRIYGSRMISLGSTRPGSVREISSFTAFLSRLASRRS